MKRKERKWNKHVLIVGLLLVCLMTAFLYVSKKIIEITEDICYETLRQSTGLLYCLAALIGCLLVAYFAWLLILFRKAKKETEMELNQAKYMLKVEQILYDAHRDPNCFTEALREIATILSAELAVFTAIKNQKDSRHFIWMEQAEGLANWQEQDCANVFPTLNAYMEQHRQLICYDLKTFFAESSDELSLIDKLKLRNLMLVQVHDEQNAYVGTLGVGNMSETWENAEMLQNVLVSFSMALNNMEYFRMVKEMGMMDHLTGLQNRNCFQQAVEDLEKKDDDSIFCVYLDADGLHEINNECGHEAGDHLLQTVAGALKMEFGGDDIYRIGGDEFVAFCSGMAESELTGKIERMSETVARNDYHISVGVAWRKDTPLIHEMVRVAEERMYEAKRDYYQTLGEGHNIREKNDTLEKILEEKRVLNVFCSIFSSKYLGVYVVNHSVDTMRSICIPPYFEQAMKTAGGKFSRAAGICIQEQVKPEYRQQFQAFMDYDQIENRLQRGEVPELYYQKLDGECVRLQISLSPDYSEHKRECIWMFETVENVL